MTQLPSRSENAVERDPDVLKVGNGNFLVEGRSKDWYVVSTEELECSCPDYEYRNQICYHIRAAAIKDERDEVTCI